MSDTMAGKHLGFSGDEPEPGSGASLPVPPAPPALPVDPFPADATQAIPVAGPGAGSGVGAGVGAGVGVAGGAVQQVTCPECGTVAQATLTKRQSHDFCARCDYPLFWTPTQIVLETSLGPDDAALRRLPGTAGRQTIASQKCPHCSEANTLSAVTCVRCGQPMHVVAVAPVPVAAPVPVVEPPPARTPWWVWVLGGATLLLLIALVLYVVLSR